jgi:hypothetical protein
MIWEEAVQSEFRIITGDGNVWKPLWKNSCVKDIEYNISQFNFPNIQGSKVDRGTPQARRFNLEIYFQGEDNIDVALAFEISCRDSRPWTISHPIHGEILVQPISLKFDYQGYNSCMITGPLVETLGSVGLQVTKYPIDVINKAKVDLDAKIVQSFSAEMELMRARELNATDITSRDLALSSRQITSLKGINKTLYDIGVKSVKLTEDAGTYLNKFNVANASINQGISDASTLMSDLQAVVNFPGQLITTVKVRTQVIQSQFDALRANLGFITKNSDRINYEKVGGTLVSSICTSSVNEAEYATKRDALAQIDAIVLMRDTFMDDLDSIQSDNAGDESSYMPDGDSMSAINDLLNYTVQTLYETAVSAKQERIVILEADSNLILLTHRFYGLVEDDSTIDMFVKNNNIFLNEILQIQKGRELIFYI